MIAVQACPGPGTHGKGCTKEAHYEAGGGGAWGVRRSCRRQERTRYHAHRWPSKCHTLQNICRVVDLG